MSGQIPLIKAYLEHVQGSNNAVVNEALNDLLVEESNYESLRVSIDDFDSFDQIALAQRLEKHELLEFRRISAYLYKRNRRMKVSIELSKRDKLWQDAMETGATSQNKELAEELLRFFVDTKDCPRSCFAACLFTCYKLIRPDVVLELAWRNNLIEFAMPYMVQTFRTFSDKLDSVEKKINEQQIKQEEDEKKAQEQKEADNAMSAQQLLNNAQYLSIGAPQGYVGGYQQPNQQLFPQQNNVQYNTTPNSYNNMGMGGGNMY